MPKKKKTPRITSELIEPAADLIGMKFTKRERKQMRKALREQRKHAEKIRAVPLDNVTPMGLLFDPRMVQPVRVKKIPRRYAMSPQPEVTRPDNLEELAFAPLTQLSELIRTRQITSLELTQMYLDRLKRYDPALLCVVTLTEDLAMQQAERADAEIAKGKIRSPLHGIPYGAKDLLATKGYPTTWGAEPYQHQVIEQNATVIERLEAAGAVLIAKLTLGALAYGDIWFGGTTKNPWNLEEGSSGSSTGSAAATAGGLVGFAIGTETLGSIVSPSTRCGTTGLRPTFGRVSRYGAMALSWSMDKIGPIARSVEDCALIFTAIYGQDGLDRSVANIPFDWQPDLDIHGLRIGYVKSAFEKEREDKALDDAVLEVLQGLGIDLIPIELPQIEVEPLVMILIAEAAAAFDELTRSNQDDLLAWQHRDAWPNTFRAMRFFPAVEYINANRIRVRLMQEMAELMEKVDVFVTPSYGEQVLTLTNLTGHPAVVLPNGFKANGSPTSISFIGGLDQEAETLVVAKAYQDATDFHRQHPKMEY
jgi:Asp-tRNA(Asn)/Glu-tRNA(Gln) amidotransferase A subunit family amidase